MQNNIIIECVPNFSEGRDQGIIRRITQSIESISDVQLLDVDPGKATNRTVVTFVGPPEQVIEAAFQSIKTAASLIDMRQHLGEHPRMGATDVCPLIPIAGISLEETARYAHKLAKRVGEELHIPVYMYEAAATTPIRQNLATIRAGEYEGLEDKLQDPEWIPDFGPAVFNPKSGATVIGARDFLVAYNVNLNTSSTRRANAIAFDVREKGRLKTKNGKALRDAQGQAIRIPGKCKSVKGIGWYIEEYGIAQISMNLTKLSDTSLHEAYEACWESANRRGVRVTGSELIGLVPKKVMLDAGRYYLKLQKRSLGIPERQIIDIAIKSLGLDHLKPFDPDKKIIEYVMADRSDQVLINMSLSDFIDTTASEQPAPGGGSVSAAVAAMGVALAAMVANLSAHKRGWDSQWESFSDWAVKADSLKSDLVSLIDRDTMAFNAIIDAIRLPKNTTEEQKIREKAIQDATKNAILVPFEILQKSVRSFEVIKEMVRIGNPNSITDAGVGALCARAAAHGAFFNVQVNALDLKDENFKNDMLAKGQKLIDQADKLEKEITSLVQKQINK